MDLVEGEDITVLLLCTPQKSDERIHQGSKLRVRLNRLDFRGSIQPFVRIGIGENPALPKPILLSCCDAEIVNAEGLFQLFPLMENRLFGIDHKARRPE